MVFFMFSEQDALGDFSMTALAWLIPCALVLGSLGLAAFIWSINARQYDDLEGAAWRAITDDPPARPVDEPEP